MTQPSRTFVWSTATGDNATVWTRTKNAFEDQPTEPTSPAELIISRSYTNRQGQEVPDGVIVLTIKMADGTSATIYGPDADIIADAIADLPNRSPQIITELNWK